MVSADLLPVHGSAAEVLVDGIVRGDLAIAINAGSEPFGKPILPDHLEGLHSKRERERRSRVDGPGGPRAHLTLEAVRVIDWAYEQRVPPGPAYFSLLDRIHQHLVPRTYVEIGVSKGRSMTLALPGTMAIGIDPSPDLRFPLRRQTRIFRQTSDEFFAQHDLTRLFGGLPVDLAFIDGMHHFEFALRDLINLERFSSSNSTILIHDCLPIDETTADRVRSTDVWSGDIWRLILLLREWRPDLEVWVVDVGPTGLGVVRGLDPTSSVLNDYYDEIVARYIAMPYSGRDGEDPKSRLRPIPSDWDTVRSHLPGQPFRSTSVEVLKGIRSFCAVGSLADKVRGRIRRS